MEKKILMVTNEKYGFDGNPFAPVDNMIFFKDFFFLIFFFSILTIGIRVFREVDGVRTSDLWNQKQLSYHLFITFSCLGAVGLCRRGLGLKSPDLKSPALNGLV